MRPNLFIVGAQKAGSTTLFEILSKQKEIFMPEKKELRFFSYHYPKGFDWYYETYFAGKIGYKYLGEADPSYLTNFKVPERIKNDCGSDVKIIMIFRQPLKRAYSQYIMNKKLDPNKFREWVSYKFEDQLIKEKEGLIKSTYLHNGNYFKALNNYLKYFKRENIHIIFFDDLIKNKTKVIDELTSFLELDNIVLPEDTHKNKASLPKKEWMKLLYSNHYLIKRVRNFVIKNSAIKKPVQKLFTKQPPKLSDQSVKELTEFYFKDDITKLENLLEMDLEKWK